MISIWWSDAKRMIIQNLTEPWLAKFRQLAKFRATFVWKLSWRLGRLQRRCVLQAPVLNMESPRAPTSVA